MAPADLEALREMKAVDWTRVVATGRSLFGFAKAWRPGLELDWLIFSSGAGLCSWSPQGSGPLLIGRLFTPEQALMAVEEAFALNYGFFAYAAPPDNHHFYYHMPSGPPAGFLKQLEIFQAQSRLWPKDGLKRLKRRLKYGTPPQTTPDERRTRAPLWTLRAPGGEEPLGLPAFSNETLVQHRHNQPQRLKQVAARRPFGANPGGGDGWAASPAVGDHPGLLSDGPGGPTDSHSKVTPTAAGAVVGGQMLIMVPGKEVEAAEAEFRRLAPGLSVVRASSPFRDGCIWLEIFPPEVSNGRAADELARRLGLDPALCAAAGNDYNDRDLLNWAGRPFVTADAPDDLRPPDGGRCRVIPPAGHGGLAQA